MPTVQYAYNACKHVPTCGWACIGWRKKLVVQSQDDYRANRCGYCQVLCSTFISGGAVAPCCLLTSVWMLCATRCRIEWIVEQCAKWDSICLVVLTTRWSLRLSLCLSACLFVCLRHFIACHASKYLSILLCIFDTNSHTISCWISLSLCLSDCLSCVTWNPVDAVSSVNKLQHVQYLFNVVGIALLRIYNTNCLPVSFSARILQRLFVTSHALWCTVFLKARSVLGSLLFSAN